VSVGALRNLHRLDLRGKPPTNLPESIAGLPSLQKLDLRLVESLDLTPWINAIEERGCAVYR
jgi:Leucine-rich repeat (LRR) protein